MNEAFCAYRKLFFHHQTHLAPKMFSLFVYTFSPLKAFDICVKNVRRISVSVAKICLWFNWSLDIVDSHTSDASHSWKSNYVWKFSLLTKSFKNSLNSAATLLDFSIKKIKNRLMTSDKKINFSLITWSVGLIKIRCVCSGETRMKTFWE